MDCTRSSSAVDAGSTKKTCNVNQNMLNALSIMCNTMQGTILPVLRKRYPKAIPNANKEMGAGPCPECASPNKTDVTRIGQIASDVQLASPESVADCRSAIPLGDLYGFFEALAFGA